MENTSTQSKPTWKNRRRVIFISLLFCAATILYVMLKGEDTELAQTIATSAFFLAGSIIGSYVFGSVWQDKRH